MQLGVGQKQLINGSGRDTQRVILQAKPQLKPCPAQRLRLKSGVPSRYIL
jgi:hypothetical protein